MGRTVAVPRAPGTAHAEVTLTEDELLRGGEPNAARRTLRAGALTADLAGPGLVLVRNGDVTLLERITFVARDPLWNVITPRVTLDEVRSDDRGFLVRINGHHAIQAADFAWTVTIEGRSDSSITYGFEGIAAGPFDVTRLGIVVIHSVASHQGRRYRSTSLDGRVCEAFFPVLVGSQAIRDGRIVALGPAFRRLEVDYGASAGSADYEFDGDDFEIEDERNWTEQGYKTYSGPFERGWPIRISAGEPLRQSVTMRYRGAMRNAQGDPTSVVISGRAGLPVPAIGFGVAYEEPGPGKRDSSYLRRTAPQHVLADLHPSGELEREWSHAVGVARAASCRIAAALYCTDDWKSDLQRLADARARLPYELATVSLFGQVDDAGDDSFNAGTPPQIAAAAAAELRLALPDTPVIVGSDRSLAEVIRVPPSLGAANAVGFGASPSGHFDEEWAIIRNLPAQGDAVRALHAYLPTAPVVVSPITMQNRFGGGPRAAYPGGLPVTVDPRQMSLVGAAWTLGSVAQLTTAGTWRATYYETTGWRGLMQGGERPRHPLFRARPGDVFPLYYVFLDLARYRRWHTLAVDVSGHVAALAFGMGRRRALLIANLQPSDERVLLRGLHGRALSVRFLDVASADSAMRRVDGRRRTTIDIASGHVELTLGPYAYARVEST